MYLCIWLLADSQRQNDLYTFSIYTEWPQRDSMRIYICLFSGSILGCSQIVSMLGRPSQREVWGAVLKLVKTGKVGSLGPHTGQTGKVGSLGQVQI